MKEIIQLLVIEDEDAQIKSYERVIIEYNKKNDIYEVRPTVYKTYLEGSNALKSPHYDAALIDLRLSNSEELEGLKLVESIRQKIRIPVFIYSGSISQIDDIEENALLKKRKRTDKLDTILKDIVLIYQTGITSFLRQGGIIDEKLTEIFWSHLSKDLSIWIGKSNKMTLLRYILAHFQEYLDINTEGDFNEYHPAEIYISPPIKRNAHTGDLIKHNNELYLILTPACDIVVQGYQDIGGEQKPIIKAEKILLVKAKEFDYVTLCSNQEGKLNKDKINNFVTNNSFRFHYLPPLSENNGFLIDFQDIVSINFDTNIERIATVSSPFIKDIIARFSIYYSRQGQPTFGQKEIVNKLYSKVPVISNGNQK